MSLISKFKEAFSKTVESVKEAFGGGGGDDDGGSQYAPTKSYRPIAKPRIGSVETPSGTVERFATVDIPSRNISAGDRTTDPESSVYSFSGLFGQDDANVMRRIQNADRMNAMFPPVVSEDRSDRSERAKGERPAEAAAEPEMDVGEAKGERPGEEGMGTGESAAARARRLGLASTIATSPGGLLAGEDATRRRRSLMGGGLIR
jgi:hypothetical protein